MSSESFAALRRHAGEDLAKLAEEHFRHDLEQQDRDVLQSVSKTFSTYAAVGSVVGLGLGFYLALRIRSQRAGYFKAFRAAEKPTHVQFAGGRTEPVPDITPILKPSVLGDIATYTFFSAGGLFVFGELGALAGSVSASRTISQDPESRKRIETAFRSFRADVLRREAQKLDAGEGGLMM